MSFWVSISKVTGLIGYVVLANGVGSVGQSMDFGLELKKEAEVAWRRIEKDYYDSGTGLFREYFSVDKKERDPAFNWTVGITISAMNGLARGSDEGQGQLNDYLKKVEAYWNEKGPVAGYDVLPHPSGVDRYYDDNAWMVLALLEAAKVTGEDRWKDRAEKALQYVLSGEDEKLGGGIYWRESDKASKNTCSNSPAAVACFEMYKGTGKKEYREAGYRVLDWVMANLYDESDGLMWDAKSLSGKIGKAKWTYNAALTIRALAFAEEEGKKKYPISSREMFEKAWMKWHLGDGKLDGPAKFSHLLFEAGVECGYLTDAEIKLVAQQVLRLSAEGRRWGGSLAKVADSDRKRFELIDEASAVRVLVLAAQSLEE